MANTTANYPRLTDVPVIALAQVSTANTNRDGTGTAPDVITGSTNGTRIDRITITATGTTTAGVVRLYLYDGTNTRLWREVLVTAITPSASVAVFSAILSGLGLVLPNTYKIKASTHNAETFNITAEGGNF